MKSKIIYLPVIILALVSGTCSGFLIYRHVRQTENDPNEAVRKVGRLMQLPDEVPTLATVTDSTKLASQTFFANTQNGDKVIIFPNSHLAILYRPKTGKIINITDVFDAGGTRFNK